MKKFILTTLLLCILCISLSLSAQSKSTPPAVDMVSYEQSWIDHKGTLALKNNTSETIHNISFVLEYLDMQGNPMDYETFSYDIDIAPGMTKKLDIPAYEHSRYYHYYKTKDEYNHPAFKLRYELKDYNVSHIKTENTPRKPYSFDDSSEYGEDYSRGMSLLIIPILLFILGVYIGLYVLVSVMAQRRNRNPIIWLLMSFIATPLLIIIILLALGKEYKEVY